MSTDIFNKKWHGIEGFGTATQPNMAVRVQTSKNGPWQSLTKEECKKLVDEHNDAIRSSKQKYGGDY